MKAHLLIVDDEEPIRKLLEEFFKKEGYEVSTAATADEAQQVVDEESIQLAILDVLLPDADGMELLELFKRDHPNLPVIIMTGIGFDEELLQEAKEKGASGYVSKTLPLDQLHMEVHRILKLFKKH